MLPRHRHRRQIQPKHSRGAVSIWAIVCLVLVIALSISLAKLAIAGSRRMIQERRRVQADWLLQSGWSLALSQLAQNKAYTGETWDIPAKELSGADSGRVIIEVAPPAKDTAGGEYRIDVVAEFPASSDHTVRVTRHGTWKAAEPSSPNNIDNKPNSSN